MFSIANLFAFTDRQILSLLVEYMRRDLNFSDTQIGLLQGFAFAFFFIIMGFPVGRWVDRYRRVNIIVIGIVLWSIMTSACGLAKQFWLLFAVRAGVGVGEATLNPAVFSMLPDYFDEKRLGMAGSVVVLGTTVGAGIALFLGGAVIEFTSGAQQYHLPVIGSLYHWQLAFFIVGIPGVLFAGLLYVTVKEPVRRQLLPGGQVSDAPLTSVTIAEALAYFKRNLKAVLLYTIGFGFGSLSAYAMVNWTPAYLIRVHGWSASTAGIYFGIAIICASIAGLLSGGALADWLAGRGHADGKLKVGIVGVAGLVFPLALLPFVSGPWQAIVLVGIGFCFCNFLFPVGPTGMIAMMPNEMRGQALAVYYLVLAVVGMGCGPISVALLSDYVFRDPMAVGKSIGIAGAFGGICGATCLIASLKSYRQSVQYPAEWARNRAQLNHSP